MLHMLLVICVYLLLLPVTYGSYPECREGEEGGFLRIGFPSKKSFTGEGLPA